MSGVRDMRQAFESRAQFDAFNFEEDAPSTFTDTLEAAFSLTRREELTTSAARAWAGKNVERARKIAELGGDEQLAAAYAFVPREALERFAQADADGVLEQDPLWRVLPESDQEAYRHVREFVRRYPDQVPDDVALFDEFKAEAAELRQAEQHTLERGSLGATFLGTAGAVFTDPAVLATLPFGAGSGAGRPLLTAIGRTAAIEGSIAMATEIPIQAEVLRFKREIEAPWTWRDSAINVLAAGAGGAVLGGAIGGGIEGGRRLLQRYRAAKEAGDVTPTPELDEAEQALEESLAVQDQNPLEVEGVPVEGAHEQALERARAQDARGEPIDVREEVSGLEPMDGINQAIARADNPAELVDVDPLELEDDARTFQFKGGSDAEGVTDALRGVTRFDRRLAGVAIVWEDQAGRRFIADGHQRVALARRAIAAGQDPDEVRLNGFVLREADGVTAADARQIAAVKNLAEGTGTPVDAAKLLRELGPSGEALLPPLPPRSALIRQARGLAELGDEPFMAVVNDVIDARFGALIGNATGDDKLQQAMVEVLRRTEPANETQARSIIDQVKQQGVTVRKTEDLFGEQAVAESLYLERAQVLDAALRKAREDRALFGRLVANEGRIADTGRNRLDRAANQARVQEAADAATQISALANAKGELSDALTAAAERVRAGAKPGAVAGDFLKAARREILAQHRGRREAGRARRGGRQAQPAALTPEPGRPIRVADLPPEQQPDAVQALKKGQAGQSVEDLYAVADKHQGALRAAADEIVEELGDDVVLADPGVKARATTEEKIARKGYNDAGELTDVIRLGFMVRTPDVAVQVLERLARRFGVLDEGVTVTAMGYVDHKALVRFADGRLGEIQLWDPEMARVKFGRGHELYEELRVLTAEEIAQDPALAARVKAAELESRELYASALVNASPEWRRVAMMMLPDDMRAKVQELLDAGGGSGGEFGKVSRKAARDSSRPDSSTSTGEIRDQASASDGTKNASVPSGSGASRTTAGLASKLKNRSAIDASPRSIVTKVDDEHSAQPSASKTGTVDDVEYETVMGQFEALADDLGEQLTVANEVNGELVSRSARAAIDELDRLEDTLERVRLCTVPARRVS